MFRKKYMSVAEVIAKYGPERQANNRHWREVDRARAAEVSAVIQGKTKKEALVALRQYLVSHDPQSSEASWARTFRRDLQSPKEE